MWAGFVISLVVAGAGPATEVSLDDALAAASERDLRLVMNTLDTHVAYLDADAALARALPTVTASASVTRNPKEIVVGEGDAARVVTPLLVPAASAAARARLFDGPSFAGAVAGYYTLEAQKAALIQTREGLYFNVAQIYLALVEAAEIETALDRAVARAESLVAMAEARVKHGAAVALEVDEAEAERLRLVSDREAVRGTAAELRALFTLRTGLEIDRTTAMRCDACVSLPYDLSSTLDARDDVRSADLSATAARVSEVGAWLAFLPTVEAVGNMRLQQPTLFNPEPVWWTAQLALSWTIFDGTSRLASAGRANRLAEKAQVAATLKREEATVEIRQALVRLDAARAQRQASEARAKAAGRAHELAEVRYREGALSSADVSQAASRLAEAEASATRARFSELRAVLDVRLARGLGPLDDGGHDG